MLDVAPDGKSMLIDTWDGLLLWDIAKRREVRRFSGKRPCAHRLLLRGVFTHGRSVTMGLHVWETATGRELASFVPRQQDDQTMPRYTTARFTPDGQRLIAFADHRIGVLDITSRKETSPPILVQLNNAWLSVISPRRAPRGDRQLRSVTACQSSGSAPCKADLTVRVYELASGKQVTALVGHTDEITGLAFSPDSRLIATAAGSFWHRKDRTVRVWDVATGGAARLRQPRRCRLARVSPDGRTVVTVGTDGVATVWDVSVP